jgi:subtilase family serine protease
MNLPLLFTDKYKNVITNKNEEQSNSKVKTFLKIYANPSFNTSSITNFPPQYFSGVQLRELYNIPTITNTTNKKVSIAIIVAFTYPGVHNDLKTYWQNSINFGENSIPPTINVYTMPGATQNSGWAQEECLDVQMICVINPDADIFVVESKSDLVTDLMNAINYANTVIKADVISMSWGISESSTLLNYTKYFTNNNISYCAASGDKNSVCWPATLSNCIAVGGTTLLWTPNSSTDRTEYAWKSAGCGYSTIINQPTYQKNITNILHKNRVIPDVSLIADTNTSAYSVYNGNWYGVGGTSVSTPIFAGILSLANQERFNKNKSALTTVYSITPNDTLSNYVPPLNNIQNFIYKTIYPNATLYGNTFYDITIGSGMGSIGGNSSGLTNYTSGNNFDINTGMGSPNGTYLCNQLLKI